MTVNFITTVKKIAHGILVEKCTKAIEMYTRIDIDSSAGFTNNRKIL